MKLRELEYIVAVADEQHFGRASDACAVSQPTLSGQIKKLEAELGVVLFERGRGGVSVTDVGARIVARARRILRETETIRELARAAQNPLAGRFSLGMIPTIAPYLIPRFATRLRTDLPELSVTYREDITERLTEDLLSGDLDAAVLATPPETDALLAIPLYSEPFQLVVPDGHDLAVRGPVRMSEVDRNELLLLTEGHCFRDQALAVCEVPRSVTARQPGVRATSLETIINLVAAGSGTTLVPALAVPGVDDRLVVRPVADRGARRAINLSVRASFPRLELARRVAALIRRGLPNSVERS